MVSAKLVTSTICSALVAVLLSNSSCSVIAKPTPSSANENGLTEKDEVTKTPPVTVGISQAFVDKENLLHVAVKVDSKDRLPTNGVQVALIGLRDGEVVREKSSLVSEVLDREFLNPGEMVQLLFDLELTGLTEYQVACRWGNEVTGNNRAKLDSVSATAADKTAPPPPPITAASTISDTGGLSLIQGPIEKVAVECESSNCGHKFVVSFDLKNSTSKPISRPSLAASIVWQNEGETLPPLAEAESLRPGEEVIALDQVTIAPGQADTIRVTVDRAVPEVPGGSFIPRIRLLPSHFERPNLPQS